MRKTSKVMLKKGISVTVIVIFCLLIQITAYASPKNQCSNKESILRVGELKELRSKNSDTYLLSDGTYECVVYEQDKYYYDNNGNYQGIDNSIVIEQSSNNGVDYNYTNKANSFDVNFSEGNTCSININHNGNYLDFALRDTKDSKVNISKGIDINGILGLNNLGDNSITYENVYNNIDLVYEVSNDCLKEYIVLKERTDQSEFVFDYKLNGLSVKREDSTIYFINKDGQKVYELGSLFAVDANEKFTDNVTCTYKIKGDTAQFTIRLDKKYMNSSDRVYPIVIDPTIMVTGAYVTYDSFVASKMASTNYYLNNYLYSGYNSTLGKCRTYLKFDLPTEIKSGRVTNAYIRLEKASGATPNIRAYRPTESWDSTNITWNNRASYNSSNKSDIAQNDSGSWYRLYVTNTIKGQMAGTINDYGFLIKDDNEDDASQWTKFYSSEASSPHKPELHIVYTSDIYCGNRSYVASTGRSQNCMGYALNYPDFVDVNDLGLEKKELSNISTTSELWYYIIDKSENWMDQNLGKGSYNYLINYQSDIDYNQYRVVLRVGYEDYNGNGRFDLNNAYAELFDYHWWYQTKTGQWADKAGSTSSKLISGTNVNTNPKLVNWGIYNSACRYYAIDN